MLDMKRKGTTHGFVRLGLSAGGLILAIAVACSAVAGEIGLRDSYSRGARIRADFIFNLLRFVQWPDGRFRSESDPWLVVVCGPRPFEPFLDVLGRRTVAGRPIAIRHYEAPDDLASCHVLVVCSSHKARFAEMSRHIGSRSILALGEIDGFAAMGGTVGFRIKGDRVTFDVNAGSARKARLRISSKLMRLAKAVHGLPGATSRRPASSTGEEM